MLGTCEPTRLRLLIVQGNLERLGHWFHDRGLPEHPLAATRVELDLPGYRPLVCAHLREKTTKPSEASLGCVRPTQRLLP
jgi:hypothetical protein